VSLPEGIEQVLTAGVFSLDGADFEVDNNVWLLGDDAEVIVVDPAHDAGPILDAVAGRRVRAIVATHAHNDHISAAAPLAAATGAAVALHPADRMLWDMVSPQLSPVPLSDGEGLDVAGQRWTVLHTPGHTPGGVCLYREGTPGEAGVVISGDTLFRGGPGATGRSYSDFATLLSSIRRRLLVLPESTVVLPGHGDPTSVEAEAADYDDWVARGH